MLLWLAGLSLRLTVLAVPPLLPALRSDFGLNHTGVAALTTLPLLLFGAAATLGSGIVSWLGPRATVVVGLLVAAIASAARAAAPGVAILLGLTLVMGLGIAAVQPALPVLVQGWFPGAIARATAVYVNGMLVSEAVAASITLPLLVPLLGGWQGALSIWSLPICGAAFSIALLGADIPRPGVRPDWVPQWTAPRTWRLGLLQGSGSVAYFGSNAMIPVFLQSSGHADLVGGSLAALNVSQLLASLVVAASARRLNPAPLVVVNGILVFLAAAAIVMEPGAAILWSLLLGVSTAVIFTLSLALPAVLEQGPEVARLSAGMLTIGYGLAFALPLVGGALWDATGSALMGFLPPIAAGAGALALGASMPELRETLV